MVILVYKKTEKNSFAIECTLETKVSAILGQLVQINNLRVYLDRLIWSVEQLANKGVLKPPQLQGVSWDDFDKHENEFSHLPPQVLQYGRKPFVQPPQRYVPDKHNQRYGVIFPVQTQQILLKAVQKARKTLEFQPAVLASKQSLVDAVQILRQAVMQVYPGYLDLPEWEPTLLMLQEKVYLQVLETDNFEVFDQRGTVWWAGKELQKNKYIGEYIGKNEKSKAVIKVQKWGGQQPMREPPVDAQTYKTMVKYYYKKVDQAKEIQKNSVQSHYEKIETGDMKSKFHLSEQIRYKPF